MNTLKCPVCDKPLTQEEYDKALGLWKDKQVHIKHLEAERKQLREEKRRYQMQVKQNRQEFKRQRFQLMRDFKNQFQRQQKAFNTTLQSKVQSGITKGVAKQQKELQGTRNKMMQLQKSLEVSADKYQKANEEIKRLKMQMEQGITSQIEGLLEEKILLAKLKELYPQDRFEHTGKGGDILQTVMDHGKITGLIVYECKKVKNFDWNHVEQAKQARSQRKADFAVLVTNAFPKKRQHYFVEKDVFVISPVSLEPISYTLRESLVRMAVLKITNQAKEQAVQRVCEYLSSHQYNTKMNGIASQLLDLGDDLKTEVATHKRVWIKRYKAYKNLFDDIGDIEGSLRTMIHGLKEKQPLKILPIPRKEYVLIQGLT
jgi:hypothetical protein